MVPRWLLIATFAASMIGAVVWGHAASVRNRFIRRLARNNIDQQMIDVAAGAVARDAHAMACYLVMAAVSGVAALSYPDLSPASWLAALTFVPVTASVLLARYAKRDARLTEDRIRVEQRAYEMLSQADVAPNRWAARLAPELLPDTPGYEVGAVHQAGTGVMSGDLMDVFHLPSGRLCSVVGDVSGHDIEASITALQTKFLLRSYLRRYRDPAQALEELNRQLVDFERPEEFVSLCVVIFDPDAGTVRYASAGHPAVWLCQERVMTPLRSTGPLLMMERESTYLSRELPFGITDVIVLSTDGLTEARSGDQFFGEERIAGTVRRHHDMSSPVLCKELLDAATAFSDGPIADDVTILAVRKL
jgi:serine phosphatase RsbU (regulator of sigma subunit)